MNKSLKILLAGLLLACGAISHAGESSDVSSQQQAQTPGTPAKVAPAAETCLLADGGRCPACCTGCGTKKEDCSECKSKDKDKGKKVM